MPEIIGEDILKGNPYPPYHNGDTFEEYACKYFLNKPNFYAVFWTRILNCTDPEAKYKAIQDLVKLPKRKNGFTISTHDDAPITFCDNLLKFAAGGNIDKCIPIPLIASKPPYKPEEKSIFVQFCGSLTHPLRNFISRLIGLDGFSIRVNHWSPSVNKENEEFNFRNMAKSKFALCPRGYGPTSFRLYEALYMESVPIYVSDRFYLPFTEKIKWEKMIVMASDVREGIIKAQRISDSERNDMLAYAKENHEILLNFKTICDYIDELT